MARERGTVSRFNQRASRLRTTLREDYTTLTESDERAALIREALTWRGTPFRWECCIKGVGADCGRFIAGAANNAGIRNIDIAKLPRMSAQWFLHKSDESYVHIIEQFAREIHLKPGDNPKPGDIVVVQVGKDWGHSALVMAWPKIIGAATQHCVTIWNDINTSPQYMNRRKRFFSFWG